MKMSLKVFVDSVRKAESGKFYADLLFVGGALAIQIDDATADWLRSHSGSEADVLAIMRPRPVTLFNRPVTLFEISRIEVQ